MRHRLFLASLAAGLVWFLGAEPATAGDKKLRVVLIDGQNNHNWKATTPVMKEALEKSGRFTVDVATSPQIPPAPQPPKKPKDLKDAGAAAKYEDELARYKAVRDAYEIAAKPAREAFDSWHIPLERYDVVVSNYNGQSWPKAINDALDERLKSGKIGLVIVHAANNAFGGWKEYNQMIGMGWRGPQGGERLYLDDKEQPVKVESGKGDGSGHRYTGPFQVVIRDAEHPVTRGMPREWLHNQDELYDNMRGPIENVRLLATAFSKGTKVHEPMIWTISYGSGRVFHTPMGHDANAMRCVGFQATLNRGTEWAATGSVTLPLPSDFPTATKASVAPAPKN